MPGIRVDRRTRGPSFCHVHKRRQLSHEIQVITCGNQKWQGAPPSFNTIARARIGVARGGCVYHIIIHIINIIDEPKACARKYLIAPSVSWRDLEKRIRGINLRTFNSHPAHTRIQFGLERVIKVLITMKEEKRSV